MFAELCGLYLLGVQAFVAANSSGGMVPSGVDGGNDLHLLARKMALDRQRSIPSTHPYWPGMDPSPVVSNSEVLSNSVMSNAKQSLFAQ